MHISEVRVRNYKGFHEPEPLCLTPGFNLVVGQNNVGKSALLEALGLKLQDRPHRSVLTLPSRSSRPNSGSEVEICVQLSRDEIQDALDTGDSFQIPLSDERNPDFQREFDRFVASIHDSNSFRFRYGCRYREPAGFDHRLNSFGGFDEHSRCMQASYGKDGFGFSMITSGRDGGRYFGDVIERYVKSRVYTFKAERMNVGYGDVGNRRLLESDASNLPEVLNVLKGNPGLFRRLNQYVRAVFPSITEISVAPRRESGSQVEVFVWSTDTMDREDLAVPMSQSGTGIGQVLAMLYVALTAEQPQTVIIDEPQSFLHPGAVRKLVEILRQHEQHQFILATHSPAIVAASDPNTITLVRKHGAESIIEAVDVKENRNLEMFLSEVGAQLSDVFGADSILWVEGKTEEIAFPVILRQVAGVNLLGTRIIGVSSTGDFEGRHAGTILDIYTRLSKGGNLLPPAVGFVFDREQRNEQARKDLVRASGGLMQFIPRRMYENYLLNPAAVAHVLSEEVGRKIPVARVRACFKKYRNEGRHMGKDRRDQGRSLHDWHQNVHGARVLEDVFAELSDQTVTFRKPLHPLELTKWIASHAPNDLAEIAGMLERLLDGVPASAS
jgi:hypothetical protein